MSKKTTLNVFTQNEEGEWGVTPTEVTRKNVLDMLRDTARLPEDAMKMCVNDWEGVNWNINDAGEVTDIIFRLHVAPNELHKAIAQKIVECNTTASYNLRLTQKRSYTDRKFRVNRVSRLLTELETVPDTNRDEWIADMRNCLTILGVLK